MKLNMKVDLDDTMAMKKRLTRVREQWNVSTVPDIMIVDKNLELAKARQNWQNSIVWLQLSDMNKATESDDDWVCLVMDGEMYYDVEFDDDKWLRVHMQRGDLIVVPKGIWYRSTVTPTVGISGRF